MGVGGIDGLIERVAVCGVQLRLLLCIFAIGKGLTDVIGHEGEGVA